MIKKADAYVQEFIDILDGLKVKGVKTEKEDFVDTIIFICKQLVMEIKEIMLSRRATSDSAFMAVVKEQDQKWKAIARRLAKIELPFNTHPDAFQKVWGQFQSNMMKHD